MSDVVKQIWDLKYYARTKSMLDCAARSGLAHCGIEPETAKAASESLSRYAYIHTDDWDGAEDLRDDTPVRVVLACGYAYEIIKTLQEYIAAGGLPGLEWPESPDNKYADELADKYRAYELGRLDKSEESLGRT